jgi:hypothetical protein
MADAQAKYLLLLAVQEHDAGPEAPALLDTLLSVARTSQAIGDVPQAQASLRRYLDLAETTGVADAGQRWRVLAALARTESLQEHHDAALELQRSAVAALDQDAGAGSVERAVQLESLAQMEILHGAADSAEELLARAVKLRAEAGEGDGAEVLAAAAVTALGAAEPGLAERLALRASDAAGGIEEAPLEAVRVLAEAAWLEVRRGSGSLAELLAVADDAARLTEADARLTAYLGRLEELPEDAPERVETLSRLARVAAMRGDLEAAVRWQRRLADALAAHGGEPALRADDGLAFLLVEAGRPDEALTVNTRLLEGLGAQWGEDDPRLAPVLERQAGLLAELGHRKQAKAVRKRLRKLER